MPEHRENQRSWDSINTKRIAENVLQFDSPEQRARVLALKKPEAGN